MDGIPNIGLAQGNYFSQLCFGGIHHVLKIQSYTLLQLFLVELLVNEVGTDVKSVGANRHQLLLCQVKNHRRTVSRMVNKCVLVLFVLGAFNTAQ